MCLSAYATDTYTSDGVPLKPVGCQVIREAQSAQLHRHKSPESICSRQQSAREEGRGEVETQIKEDVGGNEDTATSQSGGNRGAVVVGSL